MWAVTSSFLPFTTLTLQITYHFQLLHPDSPTKNSTWIQSNPPFNTMVDLRIQNMMTHSNLHSYFPLANFIPKNSLDEHFKSLPLHSSTQSNILKFMPASVMTCLKKKTEMICQFTFEFPQCIFTGGKHRCLSVLFPLQTED